MDTAGFDLLDLYTVIIYLAENQMCEAPSKNRAYYQWSGSLAC